MVRPLFFIFNPVSHTHTHMFRVLSRRSCLTNQNEAQSSEVIIIRTPAGVETGGGLLSPQTESY